MDWDWQKCKEWVLDYMKTNWPEEEKPKIKQNLKINRKKKKAKKAVVNK